MIDVAEADRMLTKIVAPWVVALGLRAHAVAPGRATLLLPLHDVIVIPGAGTMSGQALLAAADTATVIAISAHFNAFKPITTVNLSLNFVAPARGDVLVSARATRIGRRLAFASVECLSHADQKLVAEGVSTFAIIEG